ncbi:hypothetical protein PHLCEN_2v4045 [Hermanssonia centrifuga]|uniref:Uncharacterized protein n=1 Tax=Hermanssonia centrifuga TaxID=98765 RepID=A0A2R6Q5G0_9APHY|nr:hypothetical protein PHLCEN_2v4045 [Hermanssonia centrifuga]
MSKGMYLPTGRRRSISDPLSAALLPPPNETPAEREGRLQAEQEAKMRSDNIDKMLRESERQKRKRKVVKVLLLGQSESGKSTTLKRGSGRPETASSLVAHPGHCRILDAISPEPDAADGGFDGVDDYDNTEPASIIISSNGQSSSSSSSYSNSVPNYDRYVRALTPLLDLEQQLMVQLSDPEDNEEHEPTRLPHRQESWNALHGTTASVNESGSSRPKIVIPSGSHSLPTSPVSPTLSSGDELSIRNGSNWKKHFALGKIRSPKYAHSGELQGWWEDQDDPVHILNKCAPVMSQLWRDPAVRQKLAEKRIRLEESSGL